jgi:hypothetical protein
MVEERGGLYGMSLKKAALISRAVFSGATTRKGLLGRLNSARFRARKPQELGTGCIGG